MHVCVCVYYKVEYRLVRRFQQIPVDTIPREKRYIAPTFYTYTRTYIYIYVYKDTQRRKEREVDVGASERAAKARRILRLEP